MFRIKPTRNQTTAKHTNLSPYPNNQLLLNPKAQQKSPNRPLLGYGNNKIPQKLEHVNLNNDKRPDSKVIKLKNDIANQVKKTHQFTSSNGTNKVIQVNNPQKATKILINPSKNIQILLKNTNNNNQASKQQERVLLKRAENQKEHKIKIETVKKNQIPSNLSQNTKVITTLKKQPLGSLVKRKQSALGRRIQKVDAPRFDQNIQKSQQQFLNPRQQKQQKQEQTKELHEFKFINNENKQRITPQVRLQLKPESKVQQISKQKLKQTQLKNPLYPQIKPPQSYRPQSPKNNSKNQITYQKCLNQQYHQKNQQKDEDTILKQKEMQELMIKIQKRRQARQQQKRRLKQIQKKRKENQQRALEFLNSRNQQQNIPQSQGVTGMLKLNDQLMHFSLAQTIMDLQIKKLLKTNFQQFPNKSQIHYQIQQLQRINTSYEMIRDDPNNPLKNGLQNYRVQIFNKIGDLIMQAQQGGYSNPNFHILEHDGRVSQGPNSLIPQAVRGLPEDSLGKFIRFEENDEEDQCTICLGEIQHKQLCAHVECGHKFHSSCIKEWVKSSANCPTCRFNIKFGRKDK